MPIVVSSDVLIVKFRISSIVLSMFSLQQYPVVHFDFLSIVYDRCLIAFVRYEDACLLRKLIFIIRESIINYYSYYYIILHHLLLSIITIIFPIKYKNIISATNHFFFFFFFLLCTYVNPIHMRFFNSCRPDKSPCRQRKFRCWRSARSQPWLDLSFWYTRCKFTPPPRKVSRSEMSKRV